MTVIKLGGCNGSGKSTIARCIRNALEEPVETVVKLQSGRKSKVFNGTFMGVSVYVLGKYDNACGGMDTISDKFDRFAMVQYYASRRKEGLVFFEGLITGKTYGALGELSERQVKQGIPWLYAFMDTPWDECVNRVLQRRADRREREQYYSGPDMFDPERTMRPTYNSIERLQEKLRNGQLHPHPQFRVSHRAKPLTAAKQLLCHAVELHNAR